MRDQYHLALHGKLLGCFTLKELRDLWTRGEIGAETLFCQRTNKSLSPLPEWNRVQLDAVIEGLSAEIETSIKRFEDIALEKESSARNEVERHEAWEARFMAEFLKRPRVAQLDGYTPWRPISKISKKLSDNK